jgi:hypothetical protein
MATWQPQPAGLAQLCELLKELQLGMNQAAVRLLLSAMHGVYHGCAHIGASHMSIIYMP